MSESIYLLTLGFFSLTVLLVFGMRFLASGLQARARIASAGADRAMAEQTRDAHGDTAIALAAIQSSIADLRTRLAAIEKILKAVE